jgi:hypothetical protein
MLLTPEKLSCVPFCEAVTFDPEVPKVTAPALLRKTSSVDPDCATKLFTTTFAEPVADPAFACTVVVRPASPAVNSLNDEFTDPPPLCTDHANTGSNVTPNWSFADAVKICELPPDSVAVEGLTVTLVGVWFTPAPSTAELEIPFESVTVTRNS